MPARDISVSGRCAGARPMKLRPRFRVRTITAVIALIALGFGMTFELKNHIERDRLLKRRADCYREAALHFLRLRECDRAEKDHLPYSSSERIKLWTRDFVISPCLAGGFGSWESEYNQHLYWGDRVFYGVEGSDRLIKAVEAKLLFAFPKGR
jgi:hypothetical protein